VRIRAWHAAFLLLPAGAAAALLAASRSPDPGAARDQRRLAERMLVRLERRVSDLEQEDRKFEAEIVRVEDRYRKLAVERSELEKDLEKNLLVRFEDEAVFRLTVAWKGDLTSEIWAMEVEIDALGKERDAIYRELEELMKERATAPPERGAELDREIEARRKVLAAREEILREAGEDLVRARHVLTNR
jgi:septal ring factor EnvC (AmiA/AmiB activator)